MRCSKTKPSLMPAAIRIARTPIWGAAEAIRRIVTASDDLQLTRLYFDMPAFHDQLHQELLDEIYPTLATAAIPSHSQVTQADIDAKQKKHEPEQNPDYQLLSRLKADCDYFLGAGGRAEKHLWAGSVRAQIAKMREIYETLPAKPEWLTKEAIDDYDEQMTPQYQVVVYHHFENGFDEKIEYQTLEEAIKVAQGYVNGTMESDGLPMMGPLFTTIKSIGICTFMVIIQTKRHMRR